MTNERKYLVLSAVGPDRVGLVEEVAHFVFERGGNIEDSRMALLGGEFSLLVLISGSAQIVAMIASDNGALEKKTGLTVQCRPTIAPGERRSARTLPYELTASSLDHPGILFHLSKLLHSKNINIESVETRSLNAPVSGSPIFQVEIKMAIPADVSIGLLRDELAALAAKGNLDLDLRTVKM